MIVINGTSGDVKDTTVFGFAKGAQYSGSNTDPALAAAQPGPLPYLNPIMSNGRHYLVWVNATSGAPDVAWGMDSESAVDTAITQLMGALAGSCPAGTLATTGNFTWSAPAS